MELSEVERVLDVLEEAGVRFWIEGGWGVDALVGAPTRAHRDLDVDVDARDEATALEALAALGYRIETDERPTRVELVAAGGWVDVHPLRFQPDGTARQADPDGGFWTFRAEWFTTGRLGDRRIPTFTLEAQREFHRGYELRDVDRRDLATLDRVERGSE